MLLSCLIAFTTFGQESDTLKTKKWYVPDYVKVQYAGNIGLFSVGAGYDLFSDLVSTELLYGYVPESVSEAKEIHTITLKNTFPLYTKHWDAFSASAISGFTFSYETGNNSQLKYPDKYPEGYYFTNAFHMTFFGGINLHKEIEASKMLTGIDFYIEFGTLETYLFYKVTSNEVGLDDVFSTAIGINLHL